MDNNSVSILVAALVMLGGCTPTAESMKDVPIVQVGSAIPEGSEFILLIPAGKPIPVVTTIKGSALVQDAESTLNIASKKDIYEYKEWASFDRKTWKHRSDFFDFKVDVKMPDPVHPKPGVINIKIDFRQGTTG